ncbi:cell division protein FtsB [Herbaspirillum rubrisubalbicans]|jgi:cell division protein FtsB|uniref:Cell division protein FtsB n=2 Tax=Herbaspirillum rubrisubalbicans TaxID=80842 RepID=A0ABX9BZA4_9BURK|nr:MULTISPECIES: cell division protein FtsB [Herbaspirillum]MCP1573144.1 cell division protein FtsB [Herbaspirillum rubrisubalbicans]NQE47476.1 cell division protein FtsB [Herbaspirillum rubrisubalbicans]QJQ01683.1 cell division protein FtsB [Herbaspirillum rubrisubalbicans Os34]RAM63386.1 cell division protein FtsB [Herbaspirillum rubrisubalbicans]RAN48380.1 cell division protein FtsB [Herbaspirillum rubrisubalbicans]
MRLIILCLSFLLVVIQYPLWLGKGGWFKVWELDRQVQLAHKKNDELKERNAKLASEVDDLKQSKGAVEERARFELGMIKQNEVFIQLLDGNSGKPASAVNPNPFMPNSGQPGSVSVPANTPGASSHGATR